MQGGTYGYGMGKGKEPGCRGGGVVRSSAVERFAAWECEDAEVNNPLTYHKHAP